MVITKSVFCILVLLLAGCYTRDETTNYRAFLLSITPRALAQDLLHIVRTIALDAKFGTYKDFSEEFGSSLGKFRGLYVTDISVAKVEYTPESLYDKLVYTAEHNRVALNSTEPFIKYTFTFKWAIKMLDVHASFGSGNFTISSSSFYTSYEVNPNLVSFFDAKFNVSRPTISGLILVDQAGFVDWIYARLVNQTLPELTRAVEHNSAFIVNYLFKSYEQTDVRLANGNLLRCLSFPYKMAQVNDLFRYSFFTRFYLNGQFVSEIESESPMVPDSALPHYETAVQMSPDYIPYSLGFHAKAGAFDDWNVSFDMRKLGMSGTVGDFLEALPDLDSQYTRDTPVEMKCHLWGEVSRTGADSVVLFPVQCVFSIAASGQRFLSVVADLLLDYAPILFHDQAKLFGSKFSVRGVAEIASKPAGNTMLAFLRRLLGRYASEKFCGRTLEVPGLRYEPLREYSDMFATIQDGVYMSAYNMSIVA